MPTLLQINNRMPWPLNDGGNRVVWHTAKELRAEGYRVLLATLNTKKHFVKSDEVPGYDHIWATEIDTTPSPFQAIIHFWDKTPYNIGRFWSDAFAKQLESILKSEQIDLIQIEGAYMALYIPVIRKHFKGPVLLRSHNVEYKIWERMGVAEKNPLKRLYFRMLAKQIRRFEMETMSGFDGIIPITPEDEHWYREHGFKKMLHTIPGGADPLFHYPETGKAPGPELCFLGSLEWLPNQEGLDWFLEKVWPLVRNQRPDAHFHIAGKNPSERYKHLDVPGVVFHGEVADAGEFLLRFRMMVIPLLSGSGMRIKAAEALSSGMVIVGTSVGMEGIGGIIGRHYFVEDTPARFAKVITDIITDTNVLEAVSKEAKAFGAAHFSWDRIGKMFREFYARFQGGKAPSMSS